MLTLPFITHIGGLYMNSRLSKRQIQPFIQNHHIDMDQYENRIIAVIMIFLQDKSKKKQDLYVKIIMF